MGARKKWATSWSGRPDTKTPHGSERAVYDWIAKQAARIGELRTPIVSIWVDERLGRDWELWEREDLREHAAAQNEVAKS